MCGFPRGGEAEGGLEIGVDLGNCLRLKMGEFSRL